MGRFPIAPFWRLECQGRELDSANPRLSNGCSSPPPFEACLSLIARQRLNRRLQSLRYLRDCSDCFRLERLPGGTCTHWKAPPLHGAHPERTSTSKEVDKIDAPQLTLSSLLPLAVVSIPDNLCFATAFAKSSILDGCWHVECLHAAFVNRGWNSVAVTCQPTTYIRSRQPGRARRSMES